MQTDVEERMQEGLADLRESPAFELPNGGVLDHNPFGAQSNRETARDRRRATGVPHPGAQALTGVAAPERDATGRREGGRKFILL